MVDATLLPLATGNRNNHIDYRNRTIIAYATVDGGVVLERIEQAVELPEERKCEALQFGNAAPLTVPTPTPPANAGVNPGLIFINREKIQPSKEVSMQRGGSRSGAGRPKGAISLSTRAILEAAESGGEMPIAYMLRIMRDETVPDARRDRMAKAAAAYLHSKLSAIGDEADQGAESVGAET